MCAGGGKGADEKQVRHTFHDIFHNIYLYIVGLNTLSIQDLIINVLKSLKKIKFGVRMI